MNWVRSIYNIVFRNIPKMEKALFCSSQQNTKHLQYRIQVKKITGIVSARLNQVIYLTSEAHLSRIPKNVDNEILNILRQRQEDCVMWHGHDYKTKCADIIEDYNTGATNWFAKYGDLGVYGNVKDAYMKQKHRMIWERRHGAIGAGMKAQVN
ncbi:unnamed protein product, partial [Meganyctiphanes norvegica]